MGNVFSRTSLRESLSKLEEQIVKEERNSKRLKISLKGIRAKSLVWFSIAVIVSGIYFYISERSVSLFLCCIVISYILKNFVVFMYESRINCLESTLEILREKQKEQIDLLKKEESFDETKRLINKYEEDSARRNYFCKLKQKSSGVIDDVAGVILGEDPSTMYALICKKCKYHNGLIHPNEYNLTEFHCYNCNELNVRLSVKSRSS